VYEFTYGTEGNRIRKRSIVEAEDIYYINGYDGKTEGVNLSYTGNNYTYNVWGNGQLGHIKASGSTRTRYYYLKDHPGSIRMTLNSSGGIAGYDDYYPFGAQMPGRSSVSSAEFRYRFTGKERDVNETGWACPPKCPDAGGIILVQGIMIAGLVDGLEWTHWRENIPNIVRIIIP
jgi:hypothetical protein